MLQFIDAHGLEEAGVDGGGIFKAFIEVVLKEGFDPNLGLFKATTDNRLYPNPHAQLVVDNGLRLIELLGALVGKAMYEGEAPKDGTTTAYYYPAIPMVMPLLDLNNVSLVVLFPGILVELPLAPFFLKRFGGAHSSINDLPTLDPELHR